MSASSCYLVGSERLKPERLAVNTSRRSAPPILMVDVRLQATVMISKDLFTHPERAKGESYAAVNP